MIRIGFFLPHFRAGGIERIVLTLLTGLDRARFAPVLILARREGALLQRLPADIEVVDLGGRSMRRVPFALAGALRQTGCDLVYSGTNAANLALLVAGRLMRRPPAIVISEHTPMTLFFREAKWGTPRRLAMRWLYPGADMIAVPYAALGAELKQALGRSELPVGELVNPVIPEASIGLPLSRPEDAGSGQYFVAAGRLSREKGFDLLLEAFARLHLHAPEVRLVLLGEGTERAALTQQAHDLGIGPNVVMPGHVDDPANWFQHAEALVVSSRREGTPNVIVEAMAVGTPVITTNCSYGPRWLVQDGAAGLVADPRDTARFAEKMKTLLDDQGIRDRLRHTGFRRARMFTHERAIPKMADAFEELAGARHRILTSAPIT
jgi:glycosyltransferase involved in cell wall biosynthesis